MEHGKMEDGSVHTNRQLRTESSMTQNESKMRVNIFYFNTLPHRDRVHM